MIDWLLASDHRTIGRRYLWLGLAWLFVGGALAVIMRWSLTHPGAHQLVTPAGYTQLFTFHGSIMIFFAVSPIAISGLGQLLIPPLVGARGLATPRLGALSFWALVIGSVLLVCAAFDPSGSAAAGWTAYPPLSTNVGMPGRGLTLWALALVFAGISSTLGAVSFIVTIVLRRAPGMSMLRMPLTVWGLFLASVLNALFVPVVLVAMLLLLCDRLFGTHLFIASAVLPGGGDPLVYQHLFWIFGHPEVYILILPTWGVVSDLLAWYSGRPAWGYRRTVLALVSITVVSALVYGHHMYATSMSPLLGHAFMMLTMLVSVPSTVLFLDWMGTIWGGRLRNEPPLVFALGVMIVFAIGGLSGLFLADVQTDLYLHDTYFVVGHFHLTMAAAVVLGLFAALYHYYPTIFGRRMSRTLGLWHFWLTFVPMLCVFGALLRMGQAGLPRRLYDISVYAGAGSLRAWNVGATYFAYVLGVAQLVFMWNFVTSLRGPLARDAWPTLDATIDHEAPDDVRPVVRGPHEPDGNGAYLPQRAP